MRTDTTARPMVVQAGVGGQGCGDAVLDGGGAFGQQVADRAVLDVAGGLVLGHADQEVGDAVQGGPSAAGRCGGRR